METITTKEGHCTILDCTSDIKTRDWFAWNNLMPPGPFSFYVKGSVEVPNLGVIPKLIYKVPQGINPDILLLNLVLIQLPGKWLQKTDWVNVRYDSVGIDLKYTDVNIFCGDDMIADIEVVDVH